MSEDDFTTLLNTGEEVPVRRAGEVYIVAYDHLPVEEFLHYVDLLLRDEGMVNEYDEEDVSWVEGLEIDFGDFDDVPRIKFNSSSADSINATVLECW